jgi:4Fe-4S binding domain
LCGL